MKTREELAKEFADKHYDRLGTSAYWNCSVKSYMNGFDAGAAAERERLEAIVLKWAHERRDVDAEVELLAAIRAARGRG